MANLDGRFFVINRIRLVTCVMFWYMLGTQLFLQAQVLPHIDCCAVCPVLKCFFAVATRFSEGNKVCGIQSLTHIKTVT